MAIVKMNHFTLLTFEQRKRPLLKALQAFENVHFKRLSKEDFEGYDNIKRNAENAAVYESDLARVTYAANRLKPYAELPTGLKAMTAAPREMTFDELDCFASDKFNFAEVCEAVRNCDERLKAYQTELTRLKAENDNLRLWSNMDVAPAELDKMKAIRYAIGSINKNTAQAFLAQIEGAFPNVYLENLHTVKDDTVFFAAAPALEWEAVSVELKNAGFARMSLSFTGIPADKARENARRIDDLNAESDKVLGELKTYADNYEQLMIAADCFRTALERSKACENFMNLSNVIVIEGWVPADKSARFTQILEASCGDDYYLESEAVEKDSADVPIALKNNKVVASFESITAMFSMPHYNEIDPTPILMPFYWFFFGIMVGDLGYGILLLIGTSLALKFLHFKPGMRKFVQFFFYLSFSIILSGILFGGLFGTEIFKPILKDVLDIQTMLIVSIAIGLIQIIWGLGVKGYMLIRDGKPLDAVFDSLLWIVALLSGIGLIVSATGVLPAAAGTVCGWGLGISLVGLAFTQGRENKTIVGKAAGGLYGVYGITGYIGDLVSYTRLVALSLSGAYIASSFNMMVGLLPNMFAKIIGGTLIVLAGHSLNVGLALLGAYVHTCRLQYVEFFGKFYEGGGVPFKPLAPMNDFVQLKNKVN